MKRLLILIVILLTLPAIAQQSKIQKVKTKGEELAAHSFTDVTTQVSLLNDIPAGTLQSITFYFNSGLINMSKKAFAIEYKDTDFTLAIYEVNPDGTPGKSLTEGEVQFTVKANHKGALLIDVSALNIPSQPQLFIGMASVNEHTTNDVVLKVRADKKAVSYVKTKGSAEWQLYQYDLPENSAINMVVGVR